MKVYTKTGDDGSTALLSGSRVSKTHPRIEVYGQLDSLNSIIGLLISFIKAEHNIDHPKKLNDQVRLLISLQNELFNLGSHFACDKEKFKSSLPPLNEVWVSNLEKNIDSLSESLPPLTNFILPGGHLAASQSHLARTQTRFSERLVIQIQDSMTQNEYRNELIDPLLLKWSIQFLNRLSDYFFVFSRYLNLTFNEEEVLWQKN